MIREAIDALVSGRSLDFQEASAVMNEIMEGEGYSGPVGGVSDRPAIEG